MWTVEDIMKATAPQRKGTISFIRSHLSKDLEDTLDRHHKGELYSFVESMNQWDDTGAEMCELAKLMLASGKWALGESFSANCREVHKKIAILPEDDGSYYLQPYNSREQKPVKRADGSFEWVAATATF